MGIFGFFQKKKEPSKEPVFKEKRILPRWKISSPAKIRWDGRSNYVQCEVRDLNMKGFCLVLPEKIPNDCLRAELYFNEKFFFNVEIAFVWHKEADCRQVYGVRFTRIKDLDKEKIFQMMKENFSGCFGKLL